MSDSVFILREHRDFVEFYNNVCIGWTRNPHEALQFNNFKGAWYVAGILNQSRGNRIVAMSLHDPLNSDEFLNWLGETT